MVTLLGLVAAFAAFERMLVLAFHLLTPILRARVDPIFWDVRKRPKDVPPRRVEPRLIYSWQRGHQAAVRPPIVSLRKGDRWRGHTPSRFHFWWISQSGGGSEKLGPMIRSDSLATKRVSRSNRARCAGVRALAETEGAIFARQRISSAIQFPIPTNPLCSSRTALIGARA